MGGQRVQVMSERTTHCVYWVPGLVWLAQIHMDAFAFFSQVLMLTVFLTLGVSCIPLRLPAHLCERWDNLRLHSGNSFQRPSSLLHICYFFLAVPLKSKIKCSFSKTAIFVLQTLSQPQHPHHHYSRALDSNLSTHCPTWRFLQNKCLSVIP